MKLSIHGIILIQVHILISRSPVYSRCAWPVFEVIRVNQRVNQLEITSL